ncbi:hypothetical protein NHF45_00780 [Maricaulaceae bacterium NA33B04]|nr:hypothetical protein [Maricaulaceae bacterium NA33B04]
MSGASGAGVAVGIASTDGQKPNGGLSVFNIFPKMLIPVIVYAIVGYIVTFTNGGDVSAFIGDMAQFRAGACADGASCAVGALNGGLMSISLPSGSWSISTGDLILILALIMLFFEMVKSSGSGTSTLLNHGFSIGVLLVCLLLFLLVPLFASSVFFLIIMMALIDVAGGFTITAVAARRDLGT